MAKTRFSHHTPDYGAAVGNFGLPYHLEMVKDAERVGAITRALDQSLQKDGVHCELGVGTGIFAIYAAQRCKKVYAVEKDPEIYKIAAQNIAQSKVKHKIELIQDDALRFIPFQKVDTLLVEMMSIWCINEPQIQVMNHAVRHILKDQGRAIPGKIINLVELGHYDYRVLDVECKVSIPQFSGIVAPRLMSTSYVFNEYDFSKINSEKTKKSIRLKSLMSGPINCARLSSLVQMSDGVTFFSTDSLMPQTIVPLNAVDVRAGEWLKFSATFSGRTSLEESTFGIEKV